MQRTRRPRLSWFRLFVDDFEGGTGAFSNEDTGKYLRCLLAQWHSKSRCAIPGDVESLRLICRGDPPSKRVLEKFDQVEIDGQKYLRNQKLCDEFKDSWREYAAKRRGGKGGSKLEESSQESSQESVQESVTESTPKPQPHITTDSYPPTARASPDPVTRAEDQTKREHRRLQNELGALLTQLAEHPNSRRMVPAWCKAVTKYAGNPGVSDYRMVGSIDRLEKSTEDARAWLQKLDKQSAPEPMEGLDGEA